MKIRLEVFMPLEDVKLTGSYPWLFVKTFWTATPSNSSPTISGRVCPSCVKFSSPVGFCQNPDISGGPQTSRWVSRRSRYRGRGKRGGGLEADAEPKMGKNQPGETQRMSV